MEKLNIFTVERLIFLNPKAKQVLWKEFPVFFKEYSFLKQAAVDRALLSRVYMKFLREFAKKDSKKFLSEIFGENQVLMSYNFKNITINTCINLDYNNRVSHCNNMLNTSNKQQLIINEQQLITNKQFKVDLNLENFGKNFEEILKIYPHFFCARDAHELKITFWR